MRTSRFFVLVVFGFLGVAGSLRAMADQESGAAVAGSELQWWVPEPLDPWIAGGDGSGYPPAGTFGKVVLDGVVWSVDICFLIDDSESISAVDFEAFEEMQVITGGSDARQEPPVP